MKILHLVQGYAPALGGTEFLVQRVSERLAAHHGDEVTVFTTTSLGTEGFLYPSAPQLRPGTEVVNGVTVRRFPVVNRFAPVLLYLQYAAWRLRLPGNDRLRTLYNGPIVPGLRRAIASSGAQVLAASSFPLLHMQVAAAARREDLPVVLIGGLHPLDAWGFDRADIYRAIRRADRYVAYTSFERDHVVARGVPPGKVVVIGAGIEPADYAGGDGAAFRAGHGLGADPVVAFVGQQARHKGVDVLVRAMPLVWRRVPEARLVIAGARTAYSPELEAQIAALPAASRARVLKLDGVTHERKCDVLRACDVFASPSRLESFGITFLEAWACGKPVVGTRSGAIPAVVGEGEGGLLCDAGDHRELAGALVELLLDARARACLAAAGRARLLHDYTLAVVTERLRAVYAQLAGEGRQ